MNIRIPKQTSNIRIIDVRNQPSFVYSSFFYKPALFFYNSPASSDIQRSGDSKFDLAGVDLVLPPPICCLVTSGQRGIFDCCAHLEVL